MRDPATRCSGEVVLSMFPYSALRHDHSYSMIRYSYASVCGTSDLDVDLVMRSRAGRRCERARDP